uniref:Uncharacterized protein n=1 Tax=Rhizophora mucronata TaxID=61149 RepID=A0A2P2P423_RHIMU
MHLICLIL